MSDVLIGIDGKEASISQEAYRIFMAREARLRERLSADHKSLIQQLEAVHGLIDGFCDIAAERQEGYTARLNGNALNKACMDKVCALAEQIGPRNSLAIAQPPQVVGDIKDICNG